ncbi:MAG: hypothetical protein GKR96_00260 [Gammaproteobacteria bacterium]|nr:hypothetical protein [Gammaproteobacteria bacterium]
MSLWALKMRVGMGIGRKLEDDAIRYLTFEQRSNACSVLDYGRIEMPVYLTVNPDKT